MKARHAFAAFVLALSILPAAPAATAPDADTFAARRRMFLDAVWADYIATSNKLSGRQAFLRADALFELGRTNEARRLLHRGLDQLVPGNRENRWIHGGNSGFVAWPGVDAYIRHEAALDDALKERYRRIYTGAVFYRRLSTSNHKIMAAVTRFLATQVWGPDAFHPDPFFAGKEDDGARFEKNDPTGEKYVRATIAETARTGPGEYASRPYGAENILPLLSIAECARDPDLRRRAAFAWEYSLIEMAPAWLRGHLATFSPRSYPDMMSQQPTGIAAIPWLYFGGVPPANPESQWALRAATSAYRPPAALVAAGTDRAQPYMFRSLVTRWALTHFVNRSYVLFSRSPKAATGQFMGQSYPCGVMWDEPDTSRGSHLWITNPAADDNASRTNNPAGLHTHGVTSYEQQVQHRDALLAVYDIPAGFRNPYVLGFIPGGARAFVGESASARRIFLHYGTVLVAIQSAHPIEWNPAGGIRAPAGTPRKGDSEFRVRTPRTAVALETAAPADFPAATPAAQLAAFRAAVLAGSRLVWRAGDGPSAATYTDRTGHEIACEFGGADAIDGQPVDYAAWPVLESPWTAQSRGANLMLTGAGTVRRYDTDTLTVLESPDPATR